jgi:hypothetical protein
MNSATDKSSLDRTLGAGKPVDPATRLSELLAQSLEELTRPFDPPRPNAVPARPEGASEGGQEAQHAQYAEPEQTPEESRLDADKALAELEAELFAAAKQVERDPPAEALAEPAADHTETPPADRPVAAHEAEPSEKADDAPNESDIVPPPLVPETPPPKPDADAANVIAKVRRLMLVSMAVTVIAVGAVFGFVGYRMFKGEGTTAKTADKLPEASAIPTDMTLALPRGARVIQSAVAGDRLVITLETDGKIEVRTFDVGTLQPAGRLNFSGTP